MAQHNGNMIGNLNLDVPGEKLVLREALVLQRQYTLALYRDLPAYYWIPSQFPYLLRANPPLWELCHIAYFAEFFAIRWTADDVSGRQTPSLLAEADQLFNSNTVAHRTRWALSYPSKEACFDYMSASLARVLDALEQDDRQRLSLFQLALLHEDMHAEALTMTLHALGLPLPKIVGKRLKRQYPRASSDSIRFDGGEFLLGDCTGKQTRTFQLDNELPPMRVEIAPFEIDALPVSAKAFAAWRGVAGAGDGHDDTGADFAAMHVTHAEAEAFARAHGRRLPTETEWEFAATHSPAFWQSTGDVWEWTSSVFAPYPGFVAGPYADYSAPWFADRGVAHHVLKGGSFATHPRLKYPQYRNFYTSDRADMFCGFRTCAV